MSLPYYKINKTQEDKIFFHSHIGYFNFWDKYLFLNAGFDDICVILVNRPKTPIAGYKATDEQNESFRRHIDTSYYEREPKQMFEDFPELTSKKQYIRRV